MILVDDDMGVRIVRANGMATIQILDDSPRCRGWLVLCQAEWKSIAEGKFESNPRLHPTQVRQMLRAVALAAASAAREEIAQGFVVRP